MIKQLETMTLMRKMKMKITQTKTKKTMRELRTSRSGSNKPEI